MKTSELMEKFPDEFKKIGALFVALNQIDIYVVTFLSTFFVDEANVQAEKNFIFNEALWDESIFPSIENRRKLLIKAIKNIGRVANEKRMDFDEERFLNICEKIRKVQETRNKLAHKTLLFPGNGKVAYRIRKSNNERLADQRASKKEGTFKQIEIDLDQELTFAEVVVEEAYEILKDFLPQARKIQERIV